MLISFTWAGLYMVCAQLAFPIINNRNAIPIHLVSLALTVIIALGIKRISASAFNLSTGWAILGLVFLAALPRIYLLQSVSIAQTSDYATYLVNSLSIFDSFSVSPDWQLYFGAAAANVPVICGIFALGFKIFGASLSTGLYLNVFFYTGAVVSFYFIARRFLRPGTAFLAAAIYALWPNNLCYSVSLASEPMYVFLLLGGLALFIYGIETKGIMLLASLLLSGCVLGLSQAVRPVTVIFITALIIVRLAYNPGLISRKHYPFVPRFGMLGLMLLGYLITQWGLGLYTHQILPVVSKPSYGWSVYEGANINTFGQWDAESSAVQDQVIAQNPVENVQPILVQMGIERYQSYDRATLILLLAMKANNLMGNSDIFYRELLGYTAEPGLVQTGHVPALILAWGELSFWLYRLMALCFIYVCFSSLLSTSKHRNQDKMGRLFYLILPVCGIMAIHLGLTSIQRYNYPAIPLMIMITIIFLDKYPVNHQTEMDTHIDE